MNFTHYYLGNLRGGEIVEVTLSGKAANVRLMDASNFQNYKSGRTHSYVGGHAKRSPVRLSVPRAGHWHVAIDLGGYPGNVRSGIRVLPGALPPLQEAPLASVPSLVRRLPLDVPLEVEHGTREQFDVFISHASEDKDDVVRPLATALIANGLKVWYDDFELRIGHSLRQMIDRGLTNSRFGVVVLSQPFFAKGWTNYELDGLVTRTISGEQVLLPIWHNVSKEEVTKYSPSLADKLARNASVHTIEVIAQEIAEVVRSR